MGETPSAMLAWWMGVDSRRTSGLPRGDGRGGTDRRGTGIPVRVFGRADVHLFNPNLRFMMAQEEVVQWRDVPCSKGSSFWFFHATLEVGMRWMRISESSDTDPAGLVVVRAGDDPVEMITARFLPPGLPRRGLLVRGRDRAVHANVSRFGKALPQILRDRNVPFVERSTWLSIGSSEAR